MIDINKSMKRNTKNKWIQIRVTENFKDNIVNYCNENETTMSQTLVQMFLKETQDERDKEAKAVNV